VNQFNRGAKKDSKTDLSEATQSRRRIVTLVAVLIVLVGAFIILRPRLWVKNKTAKVIVDGRLSEDVKLFHGSDGRLLFYLRSDPARAYYYSTESGVLRCEASSFASLKIIVFSAHSRPQCARESPTAIVREQSLEFERSGHATVVSWQAAPR
jgi:hypothetical protein